MTKTRAETHKTMVKKMKSNSIKRARRTVTLQTRVTPFRAGLIKAAAYAAGVTVSDWLENAAGGQLVLMGNGCIHTPDAARCKHCQGL